MTTPIHTTSNNLDPKKFPSATSEVAKMLGISGDANEAHTGSVVSGHNLPVANLPVVEDVHTDTRNSIHGSSQNSHNVQELPELEGFEESEKSSKASAIFKAVGPYLAVFAVGLVLYYFFFTSVNFSSLLNINTTPKAVTPKQTALQTLQEQNMASYTKWINSFYYDIQDPKILGPESDNSGNGLSNFQKYLLKLNPKSYDTLGLGKPDSETLANGIDPATGVALTDQQKDILNKYVDMEVVMNRLALHKLQNSESVAGIGINANGTVANNPFNNTTTSNVAPVTGSNFNIGGIEINTDIPGRLEVPSLKINAPIIFTKDTKNFDKDLQTGVVHYPGTALPGQIGTAYIAGHSSNYIWSQGSYNQVFSRLGDLANNTSFKITVVQKNGKDVIFHYVVTYRNEYLATDQEQFRNMEKSLVALSTCWPINTTAKRLVVYGELTQTEK